MFHRLSLFFTTVLALFSCGGIKSSGPEGKLISYSYGHQGSMAQPTYDFSMKRLDDKTCEIAYFNHDVEPRIENYEYVLDTVVKPIALMDSVEAIVRESKMWNYKERYKPVFEVMDGDSWSLSFKFEGQELPFSSSGYCAGPKGDGMHNVIQLLKPHLPGLSE